MEPDIARDADLGDGIERVDRARERRAGARDDGGRRRARGDVCVDDAGERSRVEAVAVIEWHEAKAGGAEAEDLDGALHGVMGLLRGVHRETQAGQPRRPRPGGGSFAGRGQRGEVRDGAAAREGAASRREADELADPADRLALDLGGGRRVAREVDVEARRERIGEDPDLEP